jgi:hypothetical protein
MSARSQKNHLHREAWNEIEICCTTLCNKEIVMDYIRSLENEIKSLKERLNEKDKL